MELANVNAAWWGLLAVPLVLLYLRRTRLRRRPVSTAMFWEQVLERQRTRSAWRRLRDVASLLVQLLLLALLVAALTDPGFSWQRQRAERVVVILDRSASMNADDVSPSRLEGARRKARALIRGLRPGDEMAILTADTAARVACGLTGHQPTLLRTLARITPSDSPTRLSPAIALGRRLLRGSPGGRIVVLTDGCAEQPGDPGERDKKHGDEQPAAADVQWIVLGKPADNVGITRFQTRRSPTDPRSCETLLEVRAYTSRPVALRLELRLEEQLIDAYPLRLQPGEVWSRVIEHSARQGGRLQVRLQASPSEPSDSGAAPESPAATPNRSNGWSDALAADNQAVAILPAPKRQRVLLVTPGNLFLEQVFASLPLVDLEVRGDLPEKTPDDTLLVYHARTPAKLPPGNVFVIDPSDSSNLWEVGPVVRDPLIAEQPSDSPLLAHVRLDAGNVILPEARTVEMNVAHEVLVSSVAGEPIYLAAVRPEGKLLLLTASLSQGDLPLRTAFPILVANALAWFRGDRGEPREAAATGETLELDLPELEASMRSEDRSLAGEDWRLRSPQGHVVPLSNASETPTIGPLTECGLWRIETADGKLLRQVACNLVSVRESDLRDVRAASSARGSNEATRTVVAGLGGRPLWFSLTVLTLALLVMEWSLYQRRWLG